MSLSSHPASPGTVTGLPEDPQPPASRPASTGRLWLGGLVVALLLLALLPPYIGLTRYQRRVTTSMAQILGRPVHLDRISLHLLPFPSFRLENLVVDEIPPFGSEPVLRAASVDARLRLLPLWHRRVEFSRIAFHDPSVNLTRTAGQPSRWNLESVLLQAAHIDAAPTSQQFVGPAPRFPYIEADGARINLKIGNEKTPFSVTVADFALWLPEPQVWRMRLRARPARTDTDATDTGSVEVEATLRRAPALPRIPIDLTLSWNGAPLGEASRVLTGRDVGLRGSLHLDASIHGILDAATLQSRLHLENLHRSDFVPDQTIDLNLACTAHLTHILHAAETVRCRWPLPRAEDAPLTLSGTVPDLTTPTSARLRLHAPRISAPTLLTWLRTASDRISPTLSATGTLSADAAMQTSLPAPASDDIATPTPLAPATSTTDTPRDDTADDPSPSATPFSARLTVPLLSLQGGRLAPDPVTAGPLRLLVTSSDPLFAVHLRRAGFHLELPPTHLTLLPGSTAATLQATADDQGYGARLNGPLPLDRLQALGAVLPMFGDGLATLLPELPRRRSGAEPQPLTLDVHRPWGEPQVWTSTHAATTEPATRPHAAR